MGRITLKRFYALVLVPLLLFSLYSPIPQVKAEYSDDFINNLVDYTLSVSGYVKKTTDSVGNAVYGVLKKVDNKYQSIFNAIRDGLSDNTVTVDSGGGVSFTPTITNNIYNILNSGGGGLGTANATFFNGNSSFPDLFSFDVVSNDSTVYSNFSAVTNYFDKYLLYYFPLYGSSGGVELTVMNLIAFDISSVAFCAISGNKLNFYDSSFNQISVPCVYTNYARRYANSYTVFPVTSTSASSTSVSTDFLWGGNTYTISPSGSGNFTLSSLTSYTYLGYSNTFASGRSTNVYLNSNGIIVGATYNDAITAYQFLREPDFITVNTLNNFPSLTGDQITNNNFDNTYNTFVTNVNNIYNGLDLPSFDIDVYKGIAQDQNKLLLDAINDGVDNIVSVIQTTSQKLDTIIGLLMHIRDMLQELPSGVGGSSGSAVSVDLSGIISRLDTLIENDVTSDDFDDTMSDLQDALDSISSFASSNNNQLIALNNKLIDLYNAIVGTQNSPKQNPNDPISDNFYYGDNYWIDEYYVKDVPINFMTDVLDNFDNITDALKDVVPFCFVVAAVNLLSALSAEPVAPVYTIPFSLERFDYNEEITIDFSDYYTLHVIFTEGFSLLFLIGMWFLFFRLVKFVMQFM